MAPQLTYYAENADSISVGPAGFTLQSGKSSALLYLLGSNYQTGFVSIGDITPAVTQILGGLNTSSSNGKINRTLPLAHPLYPWLYASGVTVKGFGQGYKQPNQQQLEAPPLPNFTAYPNYEFNVEFTPRPYVVAQDATVPIINVSFYDKNNATAGSPASGNIAAEWVRYTNWWYDRKFESITARQGFMKFRLANSGSANNVPYSDMPKLFLPDSILHIIWHQVPYRYVYSSNSYIDGLIGYINQNKFTTWQPGELLYIGYVAKPYTPPVQELDSINTGTTGFIYSAEKWVDVEFLFMRTKRKIGASGELFNNPANGTVGKPYWIQAGWNLLPWLGDRLYHYATGEGASPDTDKTQWAPLFNSAEFALLFTDPDARGAYQLNLP